MKHGMAISGKTRWRLTKLGRRLSVDKSQIQRFVLSIEEAAGRQVSIPKVERLVALGIRDPQLIAEMLNSKEPPLPAEDPAERLVYKRHIHSLSCENHCPAKPKRPTYAGMRKTGKGARPAKKQQLNYRFPSVFQGGRADGNAR